MSGSVVIAGIGPGDDYLVTPQVTDALAKATDMQIEDGKTMRFGQNCMSAQKANDKRLGLIKRLLAEFEAV